MSLMDLVLRPAVVLLVTLVALRLLQRRSAALRHAVLGTAIFAAAVSPAITVALPAWVPAAAVLELTPSSAASTSAAEPDVDVTVATIEYGGGSASLTQRSALWTIWAVGWMASVLFLLGGFVRTQRVMARAVPDLQWQALAREIAASLGLERPVSVWRTDTRDVLATFGLVRPRILLPVQAAGWSEERARIALLHELAHVRRHDWLIQMAAEGVRTLFWFNPLFWIACARLRLEAERACDDAVLGAGVEASGYASHLLAIARSCRADGRMPAAAPAMARRSTLERRIVAMLSPDVDRRSLSRISLAAAIVAIAGLTVAARSIRAQQTAPLPLTGTIYDPTGAVMPNVTVTLVDARQTEMKATTDADGRFEFPSVNPGAYTIDVAVPGFRRLRQEVTLRHAADWDKAITLQVGTLQETISVRAERPAGQQAAGVSPQGPSPVRVGGNIRPPRKTRHVAPVYPPSMRDAGREGVVPLEAIIGVDGSVRSVRVLSAQIHPDFVMAAIDAVRQWRFDPTLLNGRPIDVAMTVTIEFSLGGE